MSRAAERMLIKPYRGAQKRGDAKEGFEWLIAVPQHIAAPRLFSIFRPRYLADTEMTRHMLQRLEPWRAHATEWAER